MEADPDSDDSTSESDDLLMKSIDLPRELGECPQVRIEVTSESRQDATGRLRRPLSTETFTSD
jgi:hypothetical protein